MHYLASHRFTTLESTFILEMDALPDHCVFDVTQLLITISLPNDLLAALAAVVTRSLRSIVNSKLMERPHMCTARSLHAREQMPLQAKPLEFKVRVGESCLDGAENAENATSDRQSRHDSCECAPSLSTAGVEPKFVYSHFTRSLTAKITILSLLLSPLPLLPSPFSFSRSLVLNRCARYQTFNRRYRSSGLVQ